MRHECPSARRRRHALILRFYGIDKHSRFRYVSLLTPSKGAILDVGGGRGDFYEFSGKHGVIADLSPGISLLGEAARSYPYVAFGGESLPFKEEAFRCVICLDTIEHIRKSKRGLFVRELQRVAADRVVMAFPERHFFLPILLSIAELYYRLGITPIMRRSLLEHLQFGLPTASDILSHVDEGHWVATHTSLFGRLSAAIWLFQLFLPLLATAPINRMFARFLPKVEGRTSECVVLLRRRRKNPRD